MNIKKLRRLVKEKYDKSSHEEKNQFNSYIASAYALSGGNILDVCLILFGTIAILLFIGIGLFFTNSILGIPLTLLAYIFVAIEWICLISIINKDKKILNKVLEYKK